MHNTIRYLLLTTLLAVSACASRPDDGTPGDDGNHEPNPEPSCHNDSDCDNAPAACVIGTCSQGTCTYATSCDPGEVCNAQSLCEVPTPPPPSGNGTIACVESGSMTQVTIGAGILAHLFDSVTPSANWQVAMVDGFAVQQAWVSDNVSYTLTMPNTISTFTLAVKDPSGQKHWFDVNEFNVTGTCARGTGQFTHTTTTTTTPGNGSIVCVDQGTQTYVTISNGIKAHVFDLQAANPPTSTWLLRFGYGGVDQEAWISDTTSYVLTMPSTTAGFNFLLAEPNGTSHWFDVTGFDVTGTCSRGTNEFRHTATNTPPPVTNVGTIQCKLVSVGGNVKREVAIIPNSNGIIAGTVQEGSPVTSPEYIQVGADSLGWPSTVGQATWGGYLSTHYFYLDTAVNNFNFFVADNNDVVSGDDHTGGGDYFSLPAWSVTNVSTAYGSTTCHIVGGGINVN